MKAVAVFLLVLSCLALGHSWTCTPAPQLRNIAQIDAGQGQVVATDTQNKAYFLSGDTWYPLPPANLKHVSVGPAGTWAIDTSDKIFKLVAGQWEVYSGALNQLDAGGDAFIVGANSRDNIYCLDSASTKSFSGQTTASQWRQIPGKLIYFSCGNNGCWGVNDGNDIYIMRTLNPDTCSHTEWENIPGKLQMIEVSDDGNVFGVNAAGNLFTRDGITSSQPQGATWTLIPMCSTMKHVTYDLGRLWALTTSGVLLTCTQ